jgi:predicted ATPase
MVTVPTSAGAADVADLGVVLLHDYPGQVPLAGREQDLRVLSRLVARTPLVTLCGAGGTGKTRLLRALLPILTADYPGGVFLAELSELTQPDLVPARVAEALGTCEETGVPLADTLAEALSGRQAVLALDGCDQVAAACAALCDRLLPALPELRIIAASREPLRAAAETAWPVPPLPVPAPGAARAARAPAVALLAGAAGPGFVIDDDSIGAVAAISRVLAGLPLALELAGARLPRAGAGAACEALTARLAPDPDAAPQAVLAAVLGWTCDLLSPDAQVLLRRLSVFAGWSVEMAELVCADDTLPAAGIAALLDELADAALIAAGPPGPGAARSRMPGAIRDWAAAGLEQSGEAGAVRHRLRDYVTRLTGYVASISTGQVPAAWPVLPEVYFGSQPDAANIRAVLAWCAEHGDAETGLRICTSLQLTWMVRSAWAEGISWLDRLGQADGIPADVLGPALAVRGQLALDARDFPQAESCGQTALELCRAAGDTRYAASALDVLARTAVRAGRPADALRLSAEALDLTRAPGDRWTRSFALGSQAIALAALGRLAEATKWAQAGLVLMEEIDNKFVATIFRLALGNLAWAVGDLPAARRHYLAALPLAREYLGAPQTARCLAHLGRTALGLDDLGPAREYLAESLRLSLDCGSRSGTARALRAFAALVLAEGHPDRAVQLTAAVTALSEATGQPPPSPRRYLDAAAPLGTGEVSRLWAAGLRLTSRAAASLALQPPGTRPPG